MKIINLYLLIKSQKITNVKIYFYDKNSIIKLNYIIHIVFIFLKKLKK